MGIARRTQAEDANRLRGTMRAATLIMIRKLSVYSYYYSSRIA